MTSTYSTRKTCRIDNRSKLETLYSLGDIYVSDFLRPDETEALYKAPLEMCISDNGLVQLRHTVYPDIMYRNRYWYHSGTNQSMRVALNELVEYATKVHEPKPGEEIPVWLDIGSNDGTLLNSVPVNYYRVGMDPGVDPSDGVCDLFMKDYFSAERYKGKMNSDADIVTSIAMFYDLEDPSQFVTDVKKVLAPEGVWIIQLSYLPLMMRQMAFDNICHEHVEYYDLHALYTLLWRNGMKIVDATLNDVNGGSIRLAVKHQSSDISKFATSPYRHVAAHRIEALWALEEAEEDPVERHKEFFKKMQRLKERTTLLIRTARAEGKTVWGYGASTKGNTLLQWFGLTNEDIDAIAERQTIKHGLRTVGTDIPIKSEEEMREAQPDYLLMLPWHFVSEFVKREADYLNKGGKFIVPAPNFEIIG